MELHHINCYYQWSFKFNGQNRSHVSEPIWSGFGLVFSYYKLKYFHFSLDIPLSRIQKNAFTSSHRFWGYKTEEGSITRSSVEKCQRLTAAINTLARGPQSADQRIKFIQFTCSKQYIKYEVLSMTFVIDDYIKWYGLYAHRCTK